jgi:hypothetical protein
MDSALIDFLEGVGRWKNFYFIERLRAIQTFPVMNSPVLEIELNAVIVFLKQVCPPAKGAHDRFHNALLGLSTFAQNFFNFFAAPPRTVCTRNRKLPSWRDHEKQGISDGFTVLYHSNDIFAK